MTTDEERTPEPKFDGVDEVLANARRQLREIDTEIERQQGYRENTNAKIRQLRADRKPWERIINAAERKPRTKKAKNENTGSQAP